MTDPQRRFAHEVLVLGIGNILWADEGFGPRAAALFQSRWRVPEGVKVVDGGTLGLYLSELITGCRRLLVFDTCELHAEPGTIRLLEGDEIKAWTSNMVSLHQTGFNDLLTNAVLLGETPEEIAFVGVQPKELEDYGGSLTDPVRAALEPAVAMAAEKLRAWGFAPEPVAEGQKQDLLASPVVEMDPYEKGRPSEEAACRFGDERFLERMAAGRQEQ